MRISHLFSKTLRDVAVDSEFNHLQLALRAGLIRQAEKGGYSFMAPGEIARQRIIAALYDAFPGQPVLASWKDDETLAVAQLGAYVISSYRQLPQVLTQVNRRQRDLTPRGGLFRTREYTTFSAYTFGGTQMAVRPWLESTFGLSVEMVPARLEEHSFLIRHPLGETMMVSCSECDYQSSADYASFALPEVTYIDPSTPLTRVETPDCKTIQAVADYVGVPTSQTLKAVFFVHEPTNRFIFAVIRGDLDVSEPKLRQAFGQRGSLRPATDTEIRAAGAEPGYASPIGLAADHLTVIADNSVVPDGAFVVGANTAGYHYTGAVPGRDFDIDMQADIAQVVEGAQCQSCDGSLNFEPGIELGYTIKLDGLADATYTDDQGQSQPLPLSLTRFGVERLLAATLETHFDEYGIIWPPEIAPFNVGLILLGKKNETVEAANQVYQELNHAGIRVLFDDRQESPGVKFNDADLIGSPLRIVVSDRSVPKGEAEVSTRAEKQRENIPLHQVFEWVLTKS